jgi:hypothetical protein
LKLTGAGGVLVKRAEAAVLRAQERILAPLQRNEQNKLMELLGQMVELNNDVSRVPQQLVG